MAWWYLRSGITQPSAQASKKGRREVGDKGDSQYWLDSGDSLNVAERIELKKKKKKSSPSNDKVSIAQQSRQS